MDRPDLDDTSRDPAWFDRWREGRVGFHLPQVNGHLRRHGHHLGLAEGRRILVPLCGKSLDLIHLRDQGWEVVGVELVPEAVAAFHQEQGLEPMVTECGPFRVHRSRGITIFEGDIFDLDTGLVEPCDGLWDRAALIALPTPIRRAYVPHILHFLAPSGAALVVTLDYDQAMMGGPPFSVSDEETRELFGSSDVVQLDERDVSDSNPRFAEAGLPQVIERLYRIGRPES